MSNNKIEKKKKKKKEGKDHKKKKKSKTKDLDGQIGKDGKDHHPEKKKKKKKKKKDDKRDKKSNNSNSSDEKESALRRDTAKSVAQYRLLEQIGKGGFGIVYRGLDINTGRTVAIKRLDLSGMAEDDVKGVRMEIDLLKNLSHPNIVKYIDAIQTEHYLNIVLEFVENGSLSHLMKKFGDNRFPEPLTAFYVKQVVEGLLYLHQQGVIHRDIKGANILSTKAGVIKLADFGVATKLNETSKTASVVGTPYWMAPEIIEMTEQQSPACDIWSVGCTIIQLLTGKPPYFDLEQMPALYRIVRDEHPPLPENLTAELTDFLLLCFEKDPIRRITAEELLRHPWLKDVSVSKPDNEVVVRPPEKNQKPPPIEKKPKKEPSDGEQSDWDIDSDIDDQDKAVGPVIDIDEESDGLPWDTDEESEQDVRNAPKTIVSKRPLIPRQSVTENPFGVNENDEGIDKWAEEESEEDFEIEEFEVNTELLEEKKHEIWDDGEDVFGGEIMPKLGLSKMEKAGDDILLGEFNKLIKQLKSDEIEDVLGTISSLTKMFEKNRDTIMSFMTTYGVIPIMETLEKKNPIILQSILRYINMIIGADKNQKFQQSMSLVGLVPTIVRLSSPENPPIVRLEAANFVRHFCYANDFTRKMFIACGGLPVLVDFIKEEYVTSRTVVCNAIDCIRHIFDINSHSKGDFCRLFCKFGLLAPLATKLLNVNQDKSKEAKDYTFKIGEIFFLFSDRDHIVKRHIGEPEVLGELFKALPLLRHDVQNIILKSIKNICMEPGVLSKLEQAGAIPVLIPFLKSEHSDIQNQVLFCMYYLCHIKHYVSRQEQAAVSGIIPHLQRFIRTNHVLKQFALPVLLKIATASRRSRVELKKYDGVNFLIDLLSERYWRWSALEALAMWLNDDRQRAEFVMTKRSNVRKLIDVFAKTEQVNVFGHLTTAFVDLFQTSIKISRSIGTSDRFIKSLLSNLTKVYESQTSQNLIRKNLLRILKITFENHPKPQEFVKTHEIVPILDKLAKDEQAVLISAFAEGLLEVILN